jgi:uncharacterized membrane protein YdcZ (DUF606 family)
MEKRVFGIILTVLGIAGLILAGIYFTRNTSNNHSIREILAYGILGLLFFVAGINLIRAAKDKPI